MFIYTYPEGHKKAGQVCRTRTDCPRDDMDFWDSGSRNEMLNRALKFYEKVGSKDRTLQNIIHHLLACKDVDGDEEE